MAAEIKPIGSSDAQVGNSKKPQLINKLVGHQEAVNVAVIIPGEDGVISISDDRTVRVWLRRDTGQYWPSICHNMPSAASSMDYNSETRRLFIGMDNGSISEFLVADDFNKMTHQRNYLAHQGKVVGIVFSLIAEWVLSVARDKYFQWHCSETGRRLGGFQCNAWCTALQFDAQSKHAFIADYSGHITMVKVEETGYKPVTTLKGHSGKTLISASEDSTLVFWNMTTKRIETPEWGESDTCQRCSRPFFWNIKAMMDQKTIGIRQHHCRKCGKAVCDKCSSNRSRIPIMGYEFDVRVCDECHVIITDDDRVSMATFHEARHPVVHMHLDVTRGHLLTTGSDRVIKIWDISHML
ncbi:hypothetical protein HPB47_023933 [Ixodes persulcatus]|uniref:Uncharacterized protein n=1 Tax=Ixodes persulcatus TaxID=34615 RepID=A0AC60Q8N0_IXOPE|nr:hypothetical protein HPB47_023933 [Ixodes persulcatus]